MAFDQNNLLPLHAIYKYKIAQNVPVGGQIGYGELSEKTGLDEVNLRRFLRHAMTNRIFREVVLEGGEKGVEHTATSRVLAEDGKMNDWVGLCCEDIWPVSSFSI